MSDGMQPLYDRDSARVFDEHRALLISVAYRILGSVTDAEDTVQEAWLRWSGVNPSDVRDPRAFLVRVTTRLAIDRLRRAKTRRESYVGPWLPEPILTGRDVAEDVALAESVSMAMLVVLETLSPLERAVFVLREAFGMPYAEIADILGRKEEAVRQLGRRARDHVQERRSRFDTDESEQHRVTERFLEATSTGNSGSANGGTLARSNARGRRRWTCARASPSRAGGGEGRPLPARRRDRGADGPIPEVRRKRADRRRPARPRCAGKRRAGHSGRLRG